MGGAFVSARDPFLKPLPIKKNLWVIKSTDSAHTPHPEPEGFLRPTEDHVGPPQLQWVSAKRTEIGWQLAGGLQAQSEKGHFA